MATKIELSLPKYIRHNVLYIEQNIYICTLYKSI